MLPKINIQHQIPSNPPVKALEEIWVEDWLKTEPLDLNTRRTYRGAVGVYLNFLECSWTTANTRHALNYRVFLEGKIQSHEIKPNTANTWLIAVKALYAWALRNHYVEGSPFSKIKSFKVPEPIAQNLEETEVERLFAAAVTTRDHAILHLLGHGLRASEVTALNISSLKGELLQLYDTKNGSSRQVPLSRCGYAAILEYLDDAQASGYVWDENSPLIIVLDRRKQEFGKRLSYSGLYKSMRAIAYNAGVADFHPHRLRHTYGTSLAMAGLHPSHVKTLMGHKSDQSTRRYTIAAEQGAAINAYRKSFND